VSLRLALLLALPFTCLHGERREWLSDSSAPVTDCVTSRYRRYELASRYAFYYTAVSCAGIVSGLLAGLITQHLDGAHGIAGWRWLFVRRLTFILWSMC